MLEILLSSIEIIKKIILTVDEVAKIIENELSIDLSPDKTIVRTAQEELKRMEEERVIKNMKKKFKFASSKKTDLLYEK